MFKSTIIKLFCESDIIPGGLADKKDLRDVLSHHFPELTSGTGSFITAFYLLKDELTKGIQVEMEHTNDSDIATEIALDHLWEDPEYYTKLKTIESPSESDGR